MFNTENENKQILEKFLKQISFDSNKPFLLLDADRTLYKDDVGLLMANELNLDWDSIKKDFEKYGYTYNGFLTMYKVFSSVSTPQCAITSEKISNQIELYDGVKNFLLKSVNKFNTLIITAGVGEVIKCLCDHNNICNINIIASQYHNQDENFLIGKQEKGFIVDFFRTISKKPIIAIGDSDLDSIMLSKADIKGIVINHRKNKDLLDSLSKDQLNFQIQIDNFKHDGLFTVVFTDLFSFLEEKLNGIS